MSYLPHPHLRGSEIISEEEVERPLRARVSEDQRRTVSAGHGRTTALMSLWLCDFHSRPAPGRSQSVSWHVVNRGSQLSPLTEELWRVGGFWHRESQFSLRMWSLASQLHPSRWSHNLEFLSSTHWTQWVILKKGEKKMMKKLER